jgi:TM2 domain-containing membrane protein YozV
MYCSSCGKEIVDRAVICIHCGSATGVGPVPTGGIGAVADAKSRVTYILLGVLLGGLGIHNFYAGYTAKAVTQLLITLLTGWLIVPLIAVWIWVIVEVCTIKADSRGVAFA